MIRPEIRQKVLDMYEKGEPKSSIADRFNISRDSVAKICKISVSENDIDDDHNGEDDNSHSNGQNSGLKVNDDVAARVFEALQKGDAPATIVINQKLNPDIVLHYFQKFKDLKGVSETSLEEIGKIKEQLETLIKYALYKWGTDSLCFDCLTATLGTPETPCSGCGSSNIFFRFK